MNKNKTQVIVIGAGAAGLGAAQTLLKLGLKTLILEGRDRIGGRLWTSHQWPDAPLDMGASWIQGIDGNPITQIANQARAERSFSTYDNAIVYETNGAIAREDREDALDEIEEAVEEILAQARRKKNDVSVQTAIENSAEWKNLSPSEQRDVEFFLNTTYEHEYAGATSELSAKFFDHSEGFSGDDALLVEGYQVIANYLAQGTEIKLGHRVEAIRYGEAGVTVTTPQGDFTAEAVIVTLPLGVLKKNRVTFIPALPPEKIAAIEALGMGLLNKLYLRFPTQFWPQQYDWLGYIPAQNGQWAGWFNLSRHIDRPILLGFNAAQFAREVESWSDQAVVHSAMTTLRTMFGKTIPEPTDYQLTRWAADPFTLGSYSYYALGSNPDHVTDLAKPIADQVFFAGEATSLDYPATVPGAYLSGVRAAQEVKASLS